MKKALQVRLFPEGHGPVRTCTVGVLSITLLLTGCAGTSVPRIEAQYYGQCVQPLVRMQEADARLARSTAQGALGGALAGAVIGLIVTASNPYALPVGLGIGAAAGAAVGAGVGYTFAKLDQIEDENTRFASIRVTANQDLSKANRLQLYCYESMSCYMREFTELRNAYDQGSMLKDEYQRRFSEIIRAMNALGSIIGRMDGEIRRTESEFNASFTRVRPVAAQPAARSTGTVQPEQRTGSGRSPARITQRLASQKTRVRQAQQKNDADLTVMLEECAGKVTPPKQNPTVIQKDYSAGYMEARKEIEDLRSTHREALSIMREAALEAGIDMV